MAIVTIQCHLDLSYYFPPEAIVHSRADTDNIIHEIIRFWRSEAREDCEDAFRSTFVGEPEDQVIKVSKVMGLFQLYLVRADNTPVHVRVSDSDPTLLQVTDADLDVHTIELIQTAYANAFREFDKRLTEHYAAVAGSLEMQRWHSE